MTVNDIYALLDECTQLYICDEDGTVITTIENATSDLLDAKIINIATYNYGIEVDIKKD